MGIRLSRRARKAGSILPNDAVRRFSETCRAADDTLPPTERKPADARPPLLNRVVRLPLPPL